MIEEDYKAAHEAYQEAYENIGSKHRDPHESAAFRFCMTFARMRQTKEVHVVLEAIPVFEDLGLLFPKHGMAFLALYGRCEAKRLLNNVKDVQGLAAEGQRLLEASENAEFEPAFYPGLQRVIPQSTIEGFREVLKEYATFSKNPPVYLARCLYPKCSYAKPEMYRK
jgi:hypothetical protein